MHRRIRAVDAARATALIGMMAVHVFPSTVGEVPDERASLTYLLVAGRAAALFAVLAGVGIALITGGARGPTPDDVGPARGRLAVRAALIATIGLTLGGLPTPAAVILAYYGALFLLALPVLSWDARRLALLAVAWLLAAPVASHLLRLRLDRPPGTNLSWSDLAEPGRVMTTILLTGYYPVLTWGAYLFAGMALGRLSLTRPAIPFRLAGLGAALMAAAWAVEAATLRLAGGTAGLAASMPRPTTAAEVDLALDTGMFGTTPLGTWWWLGTAAPHSGTGPDLANTIGSALLVLGLWLAVAPMLGRAAMPIAAAGAMTLTLYSAHVVMLGVGRELGWGPDGRVYLVHVAVALSFATIWGSPRRRGPLEWFLALAARSVVPGPPAPVGGRPGPPDRPDAA